MHSPFLTLLLTFLVISVEAVLVNVTVDDSSPDPVTNQFIVYSPTSKWNAARTQCPTCTATPDSTHMFDNTWHDSSYYPSFSDGPLNATFTFNGTAIYVYCALALSATSPTGNSDMKFYIDDEFVGNYTSLAPDQRGQYVYNVSVFSNSSVPPGSHTFRIQNGEFQKAGYTSLILFDYLVYSYDDGTPAVSESTLGQVKFHIPVAAIVGAVIGGITGIAVMGITLWFLKRRKARRDTYKTNNIHPFSHSAVLRRRLEVDAGSVYLAGVHDEDHTFPPEYDEVFQRSTTRLLPDVARAARK